MAVKASTIIGGQSGSNDRVPADYYATPAEVTYALLCTRWAEQYLFSDERAFTTVWEPAAGTGEMAEAMKDRDLPVVATELHDRGYGRTGVNFLHCFEAEGGAIITNPPFSLAVDFIRHARMFRVPFALLLKATFWNAGTRRKLFEDTGPQVIYPLTWRPAMAPDRGKSATLDFMWTCWGPEPKGSCSFRPLPRRA